MNKKSREELALMSKEELEVVVLHLQEEVTACSDKLAEAIREGNRIKSLLDKVDGRMAVLLELLVTWREM